MAGIIAQLTRAARVRRDRRTYGTNKCMYTLEPFDTNGFNATIHNKYCVQKAMWEERVRNIKEEEEEIVAAWRKYKVGRIVVLHRRYVDNSFRYRRSCRRRQN